MEINPFSVESLAKIFSHSVCCLFVLFKISFAVQKLLRLMRSHLFIFVFIVNALRGVSEKMLLSFIFYFFIFIFYFFVFLPFLGPLSWHMEVPRLGV